MESRYDSNVDPLAPNSAHAIALQLIGSGRTVLELGAAGGHVTRALKNAGNHVVSVEADARLADSLEGVADDVVVTNLDWLDLETRLGDRRFDVVLAGDVLEHCIDPDLVLLQCHRLLNPNGSVVVSLPNVAHADVRLMLLAGNFEYSTVGLLDQTHLRFFTRKRVDELMSHNGFRITEWFSTSVPIGHTEIGPPDPSIPLETLDFVRADRDSTIYQYVVRAVPNIDPLNAGGDGLVPGDKTVPPEQLLGRIALLQDLVQQRDVVGRAIEQEITVLQRVVIDLRGRLEDANHRISALCEEASEMHENARAQRIAHRRQIDALYQSRTWMIGRLVTFPLRALRRLVRRRSA